MKTFSDFQDTLVWIQCNGTIKPMAKCIQLWCLNVCDNKIVLIYSMGKDRGEGHSNTTVVRMRGQRFSKHTLIAKTYPNLPEKHPQSRILCDYSPNLPLNKLFWRTCLVEFESLKNDSLMPLDRIQKTFFSKIGTFWPLITIHV